MPMETTSSLFKFLRSNNSACTSILVDILIDVRHERGHNIVLLSEHRLHAANEFLEVSFSQFLTTTQLYAAISVQ